MGTCWPGGRRSKFKTIQRVIGDLTERESKALNDLSALNGYKLQFMKGKRNHQDQVSLNTWKLILPYSVAAGLSAEPSLQEGRASLDNLKDNGACWFLYNVHTRTGNRLLRSPQPPQLHCCSYSHTHSVLRFIPEDSATHAPGTITHFPHDTTNFPKGVYASLSRQCPRSAYSTL